MKIEGVPFGVTDWSAVPETTHPGVSGGQVPTFV